MQEFVFPSNKYVHVIAVLLAHLASISHAQ